MLGPIFTVELITTARRRRYFLVRALYVAALLFALVVNYETVFAYQATSTLDQVARFAAEFFQSFAWIQLIAILLLTPAVVAGTIAQEYERRTIEYLLTSRLTHSEIVLGKLIARILLLGWIILAGLPVLAIAMMLGGVAIEALLLVFAATLITLLATAAISMAVSVWSRRAREAVTRAYLVLAALLIVPGVTMLLVRALPMGTWIYDVTEIVGDGADWVFSLNPFRVLVGLLYLDRGLSGGEIFRFVLLPMLVSYGLAVIVSTVISVWGVRRTYVRLQNATPPRLRRQRRRRRPGERPMLWKELRVERSAVRLGLVGRVAFALLALAVIVPSAWALAEDFQRDSRYSVTPMFLEYLGFIVPLVACAGLVLIAARAAGSVTSEKERDCWTMLLSTPLSAGEIVFAKLWGSMWALRGCGALLAILWLMGVVRSPRFLLVLPFEIATLAVLAVFAAALGVVYSLYSRTSLRAMGAAVGTLLFVGGGYLFCCGGLLAMRGGPEDPGLVMVLAPCIPFLTALPHMMGVEALYQETYYTHETSLIVTFIVGMVGYALATAAILAIAIDNFDGIVGRSGRQPQ